MQMISKLFKYIKRLGDEPVLDNDDIKHQLEQAKTEMLKALDAIDYAEAMALYRSKQIERLTSYIDNPSEFIRAHCQRGRNPVAVPTKAV